MNNVDAASDVSVARAASMLGYSRTTVYARIRAGNLATTTDKNGRLRVTVDSISSYLRDPPAGSWSRTSTAHDESSSIRSENARLHEVVARLRIARELDAEARRAQEAANRLLRKALKKQAAATALAHATNQELDDLLTQFLVPDAPRSLGNQDAPLGRP